jgi:drug/metabolite transporter (DMT)-like permease
VAAFFAWPVGAAMASVDLGPVVSETIAWGSSYPADKSDHALSVGGSAGVRVLIAAGLLRPWVELRAIQWLTAQRLRFDSPDGGAITADLPRTEAFVAVGCNLPLD